MRYTTLLRTAFIGIFSLLLSQSALAQDKIRTVRGEEIEGKVVEVGPRFITYRKGGAADGPLYTLRKGDVASVYFGATSHTETYRETRDGGDREYRGDRGSNDNSQYGNTIISLAPIHMTQKSATGFGLHFERVLDKRGLISFYMPLVVSLRVRNNDNYYGGSQFYTDNRSTYGFAFPGIKIYPTGSKGVVRYSVGPSIGFGFGRNKYTRQEQIYNPVTGGYTTQYTSHDDGVFVSGIVINNGLNIQPTPALHLGMELGLGYMYTNNEYSQYNYNDPIMVQFNFKIGYRF